MFKHNIDELTLNSLSRWALVPDAQPGFKDHVTLRQKKEREKEYDLLLQKAPLSSGGYKSMGPDERARARARVRTLVGMTLSHTKDGLGGRFFEDCERVAETFVGKAKEFDPTLPENDIHQALRNVWVFNSIQHYLGHPVEFTQPSFAYSLLYPYTDNWLDSTGPTGEEKQDYVRWLTKRVEGEETAAGVVRSMPVSNLIRMIEVRFPRHVFPEVYQSLLAILSAQKESLRLHNTPPEAYEATLLPLTVKKGGTSVLADGFLVSGNLTHSHAEVLFEYGVLLQLIDDLQDVDEDVCSGHWTPFARALRLGVLDAITNRLFNFTRAVLATMGRHSTEEGAELCQIIERSCVGLVMEAVARHQSYYSVTFLEMLESFSPVRLSYLGSLRVRLEERYWKGRTHPA
jgi:hypothetical protein